MKLSVIIPCFNEIATIDAIIEAVRASPYPDKEIIVVDDCSRDGTRERREIIQSITIEENRFGFEPEITAKIAKTGCRIFEVGISYYGRTYAEGKKIGWKDGVRALYCILKYNLLR